MATLTKATNGQIMEDGGATLMARVVGSDAATITQTDITTITVAVFDLSSTTTSAVATATLSTSTVVFTALQTDSRWTVDTTGYNFRDTRPASVFSTGGHRYRVEYLFDPASGEDFWVTFELYAQPVRKS